MYVCMYICIYVCRNPTYRISGTAECDEPNVVFQRVATDGIAHYICMYVDESPGEGGREIELLPTITRTYHPSA
jgi:hypothetical protein